MQQLTGFRTAIADQCRDFPPGTTVIRPQPGNLADPLAAAPPAPEAELLRIYTGGSTGAPQLWVKTARNMFGEGFALARHFAVTPNDCLVATVPPYHIYGLLFSVILPLVAGAAVIA